MTDRCEPPPELRGVDGWHWVVIEQREPSVAMWSSRLWWLMGGPIRPEWAGTNHWRYLSPVATPAEVEAMQHEIHDLRHDLNDAKDVDRENLTLRARVARLEEALRCADQFITNGIELGYIRMPSPGTPDAALKTPGIVRAALSAETP